MQYCDREEYNNALPILQKAYQLSRGLRDPSARAQASCSLAKAVIRQSLTESHDAQAEALIQEGLRELPDEPQFAPDRIFCLLNGSSVADWGSNQREALARVQSAERVLDRSVFDSDYTRLNVLAMLGVVAQQPGHYRESLAAYQRASVLVTSLGYDGTRMAVDLFDSWGFALLNAGRTAEAEDVFHRALASSREAQMEGTADELVLYGNERALRELGRFKEAREYAEWAYAKAQAAKDNLISDQLLLERAMVYIGQRNFARAATLLAEAEPLIRRDYPSGDFMFAVIASDRSLQAEGVGDLPEALRFADEAVKLDEDCVKAGRPGAYALPRMLTHRSVLHLQGHDYGKARADAERALGLLQARAEPGTFSAYAGRAYLALGHALAGQGKSDEARSAFRSAADHLHHALGGDHPDTRAARQLAGL
jgi:tetratricopeptide (TPR) repeat protein